MRAVDREDPTPGPGEALVRVSTCGVCRTDLHVVEGDLPVHRPGVVPGHEVVGVVERLGPGSGRFSLGDRIGVAWLSLDPPIWWGDGWRVSAESALPVATMAVLDANQLRNERAPSE